MNKLNSHTVVGNMPLTSYSANSTLVRNNKGKFAFITFHSFPEQVTKAFIHDVSLDDAQGNALFYYVDVNDAAHSSIPVVVQTTTDTVRQVEPIASFLAFPIK